jgi:DnaJ-class molecular chaperone
VRRISMRIYDAWRILGLDERARLHEVHMRFKRLICRHHPDKAHPSQQARAHRLTQELLEARTLLTAHLKGQTAEANTEDEQTEDTRINAAWRAHCAHQRQTTPQRAADAVFTDAEREARIRAYLSRRRHGRKWTPFKRYGSIWAPSY